jgi:hypothetical protein
MNKIEQRQCTKCLEIKTFNCFYKQSKGKYGIRSVCIQCEYDYQTLLKGRGIKDVKLLTDDQKKHRSKEAELGKIRVRKNPKKKLLSSAKNRAKIKNIEFNLTEDDLRISETCPALGILLIQAKDRHNKHSPSVDRLDATKGYTKDNINVISHRANTIKSDATFEEFEAIYKWWKSELKKRKKKLCPNTTSE